MSDLMADYERFVGILRRAGIAFETDRSHETIKIEDGDTLSFNTMGALVKWGRGPEEEKTEE